MLYELQKMGKFQEHHLFLVACLFSMQSLEENLELDTVAYNTFIKSMLEASKFNFASSIFERMCSSSVAPSIQAYNMMISVYGQDKKLDRAVEMFNKARSLDVPLDEKAYMNLIGYYGKAEKLFLDMQRQDCLPDSFMYLSLVQAYTESLNYSKAEETIHAMQSKGIPLSCAHFNVILSALTKAGLIDEANRVYEELSTFGLIPDLICHRTMMRGYLKYGCVEEGINFSKAYPSQ
ncbi:Tetratricopeptide-like helical domain superfamily [Sesbania bispinosa]|nr:Tetratricopeptide-like helical domain superfamily [Sesbania bispinosa]